jgi:hypothetical protein
MQQTIFWIEELTAMFRFLSEGDLRTPSAAFCHFAGQFATVHTVAWWPILAGSFVPGPISGQNRSMDPRRVLIPLFLLATVLVDLAALWPSRAHGDPSLTIPLALVSSQLSLAACYLVFGRAYILWRVVATVMVLGALSLLAGWAGLVDAPPALAIGTIYLGIVGGALGIVRLADNRATGRRLQFSLDEVFTAVTLFCAAMGATIIFEWQLPDLLLVPTVVWSLVMSLLTVGSLSVIAPKRLLARFIAIGLLPGLFVAAMLPLAVPSVMAVAMLALSLMVVRQAGWRACHGRLARTCVDARRDSARADELHMAPAPR